MAGLRLHIFRNNPIEGYSRRRHISSRGGRAAPLKKSRQAGSRGRADGFSRGIGRWARRPDGACIKRGKARWETRNGRPGDGGQTTETGRTTAIRPVVPTAGLAGDQTWRASTHSQGGQHTRSRLGLLLGVFYRRAIGNSCKGVKCRQAVKSRSAKCQIGHRQGL